MTLCNYKMESHDGDIRDVEREIIPVTSSRHTIVSGPSYSPQTTGLSKSAPVTWGDTRLSDTPANRAPITAVLRCEPQTLQMPPTRGAGTGDRDYDDDDTNK